jgi:hypothetical protein
VYRRADVERVLRIKQLVFSDGLTLAGVRRRIDDEAPARLEDADAPPAKELKDRLGRNARERLLKIKKGLHGILELLSSRPAPVQAFQLSAPGARAATRAKTPAKRAKPASRPAKKSSRSRR